MSEGLSEPSVQCPAGYFCLEGTFTLQPDITYVDHEAGVKGMVASFPGLTAEELPDAEGWAVETITLPTPRFNLCRPDVQLHGKWPVLRHE